MAQCFVFFCGCMLGLFWQVSGRNKYDQHTLLQITPHSIRQLNALTKLIAYSSHEVDVLKGSRGVNDTTDVLVSPRKKAAVKDLAVKHGMSIQFKHRYGRFFERGATHLRVSKSDDFNLYDYNSYDAITEYIVTLAKKSPKLVTVQALGKSYEGLELRLVKISAFPGAQNPIIFIDAGTHAREWAGPALAMYIIDRVTNGDGNVDGVDWYILPLVNPDGYEYSRMDQSNRMWRKSRSESAKQGCIGVDINRNYGFEWGVSGVSFDPCDYQSYAGPNAFSEPESRIVKNVMETYSDRIKLYVSIHAYGQYLVYPWGYTGSVLPSRMNELHRFAQLFSESVVKAGGQPFKVMSAGQWYPAAGGSDDYAFGAVKIPYAYTLEITDGHEFIFPPKLLRTALPQFYEGFKTFATEIEKEFGGQVRGARETDSNQSNTRNLMCRIST